MRRLCVFCGSAPGLRPAYRAAAEALAGALVARGIGLVYGGGSTGLMGTLADAVLAGGGEAIGVIPHGLMTRELAHDGLTALHVVATMHERKAMMAELADGFVALPGGLGTMEEILEALTWTQLGIHRKPVALLDVEGYWAGLVDLLRHAVGEGFVRPEYAALLVEASDPDALLDRLTAWVPPAGIRVWRAAPPI